ncbi:unnamed protein product [Adineta ricciae]|uniref:LITAF domain-containing protein n=1 Tax=Adineta ricciae TaxID=249248 RepID=A0A814WDA4_ADIRI|nr:unnamed protein product [Adineta ricciae]CAF1200850.1 unnamed protein product [Adineta ricciae]
MNQTPGVNVVGTRATGSYPTACVCWNCQKQVVTRVEKKNGLLTWLICGGTCLVGCFFGCCLIPFCVDACKDTVHICPNCSNVLGEQKLI